MLIQNEMYIANFSAMMYLNQNVLLLDAKKHKTFMHNYENELSGIPQKVRTRGEAAMN